MASKSKSLYVCSNCGYENPKWYGRCPQCGEWDCLEQQIRTVSTASAKSSSRSAMDLKAVPVSMISNDEEHRYITGIEEFDRVLGGGIVKGSLVICQAIPASENQLYFFRSAMSLKRPVFLYFMYPERNRLIR